MKLFIIEKKCDTGWIPQSLHKVSDYRELSNKLSTLVGLPSFRIKRVRTLEESQQIIREHSPCMNGVKSREVVEWV